MKNFNGWQRLWVFVCLLLGVGTAVLCYGSMSTESELTSWHNAQLTILNMEVDKIKRKDAGIKPMNVYEDSYRTVPEVEAMIKKENEKYAIDLENLPARQLWHSLTYLGLWAGICLSLYILGGLLNWVYRGFRPKTN